jgi:hypothetical protein
MNAESLITKISAKTGDASKQLLCLFDLLSEMAQAGNQVTSPEEIFNATLNKYYVKLSQQARANHPKILADHLLFIAENAFLQEMAHPESKSLAHAKKVAQALILAQTQAPANFLEKYWQTKPWLIGTASIGIVLIAGFLIWPLFQKNLAAPAPAAIASNSENTLNTARNGESGITAQEASAMYSKFETMRSGTCRYIEAIQIPDQDKAVYLESVVGGKLPTNLKDLATANAYLEKIDCNYTPMLMQKSK